MSHAGQCLSNPVTGERVVVRVGDDDPDYEGVGVTELFLAPGGQVSLAHVHPTFIERFTPIEGDFRVNVDGREQKGEIGHTYEVLPGMTHDFWNAGETEAHVVIEIEDMGERFETLIRNLWGLAHDGRTDDKGQPGLLQLAAVLEEFSDVMWPASPPRALQRIVVPPLAALARLRGLHGSDPRYLSWQAATVDVDPWRSPAESALPAAPPDSAFLPPG